VTSSATRGYNPPQDFIHPSVGKPLRKFSGACNEIRVRFGQSVSFGHLRNRTNPGFAASIRDPSAALTAESVLLRSVGANLSTSTGAPPAS